MYSYQMIGIADQNNRTYEGKYGVYNKESGFIFSDLAKILTKEKLVYNLLHADCWSIKKSSIKKPKKKMTQEEIEKELGYEVEIIGNDLDKVDGLKRTKTYNFPDDDLFSFLFK